MILLDTNVIFEPLKRVPEPSVLAWLDAQNIETLYLSTISLAELRFGIAALPKGARKNTLQASLNERVLPLFAERIVPFDTAAAHVYGELRARAKAQGRAILAADGYIAAIAASRNFIVATRDTEPFEAAGLSVINPWQSQH